MQNAAPSGLTQNITRFSYCLAGVVVFYLSPQVATSLRPQMMTHLASEFGYDIAHWGSWGFIALLLLCGFFGASSALQLFILAVIRKLSNTLRF